MLPYKSRILFLQSREFDLRAISLYVFLHNLSALQNRERMIIIHQVLGFFNSPSICVLYICPPPARPVLSVRM